MDVVGASHLHGPGGLVYLYSFHLSEFCIVVYDAAPGPDVAHMVVVAAPTSELAGLRQALADACRERHVVTGSLHPVTFDDLRSALRRDDRPIHRSRAAAVDAHSRDDQGRNVGR